jgi:hypothetical protein
MWRVHGAYAIHAALHDATRVVGVDIMAATPESLARNAEIPNPVTFVQADVNAPDFVARIGQHDVVFCAGVLYHMPNPLFTLEQLRGICGQTLILATASIPERKDPNTAIFWPHLSDAARARLGYRTGTLKRGVDTPFELQRGYGNWFWGLSPTCVRSMLQAAGFTVEEFYEHQWVVTAVCSRAPSSN